MFAELFTQVAILAQETAPPIEFGGDGITVDTSAVGSGSAAAERFVEWILNPALYISAFGVVVFVGMVIVGLVVMIWSQRRGSRMVERGVKGLGIAIGVIILILLVTELLQAIGAISTGARDMASDLLSFIS